jgi:hypothetical protein
MNMLVKPEAVQVIPPQIAISLPHALIPGNPGTEILSLIKFKSKIGL